ncbi:MAG: chromophore lyase CpcT/CpeT [Bacteroidia bacterium]|nr:chromophore lyase CpcT/CpeT [Bacteroidia bacterium]
MSLKYFFIACLLAFPLFSVAQSTQEDKTQKPVVLKNYDLFMLKERLIGIFSSEEQSINDPQYFNINVVMRPVWTERRDGYWIYVEQSYAEKPDVPYRQRVYHLFRKDDKTLASQVYDVKKASMLTGEWKKEKPLAHLSPDSLETKSGCIVYIHKNVNGEFYGSTPGKGCITNYKGANYVTSQVYLDEETFFTWDRGFNFQDKQVWGAYNGGYLFKKISDDFNPSVLDESYKRAKELSASLNQEF